MRIMKKNILKSIAVATLLMAPMAVAAQTDGVTGASQQTSQRAPRHRHEARLTVDSLNTYMTANLSLSDEQIEKVKALNAQYSDIIEGPKPPKRGHGHGHEGNHGGRPAGPPPQNDSIGRPAGPPPECPAGACCNGQDSVSRPNPFEKMAERQQTYDSELHKILSDKQYAAYEKIKPQFASQHKPKGKGREGKGRKKN